MGLDAHPCYTDASVSARKMAGPVPATGSVVALDSTVQPVDCGTPDVVSCHTVMIPVTTGYDVAMTEPAKESRIPVNIRLRPAAVAEIDAIAAAEERSRSDMIRILLADGLKSYRRKRA